MENKDMLLTFFLLLNPIYVTLFWALILCLNKSYTNRPKIFLGAFMAVAFLIYLSHLLYYLPFPEAYRYMDSIYQFCSLLVFPMYYIYIRLLTIDERVSFKKHFRFVAVPVLLFVFYLSGTLFMTKQDHLAFVYGAGREEFVSTGIFLYQKIIILTCRVIFSLQGIFYMYLSLRLILEQKKKINDFYSNMEDDSVNKIFLLTLTLCITIFLGIVISLLGKERFLDHSEYKLIIPSFVFSVMYFMIGWLGSKQRSTLTENKESGLLPRDGTKGLLTQQNEIRLKIERLFLTEKVYLNKDLTIWDLSRIIGTNRTYVSSTINNCFNQNFSSFINKNRVEYLKKVLEENPGITSEVLADLSGFGSVLSMQRAFLQFQGLSLKEYKKEAEERG